MSDPAVRINYWCVGDHPDRCGTVTVPSSATISQVKVAIAEQRQLKSLNYAKAWKVDLPFTQFDDLNEKEPDLAFIKPFLNESLTPLAEVKDTFQSLTKNSVHIVMQPWSKSKSDMPLDLPLNSPSE
jgi:hypothetical protein